MRSLALLVLLTACRTPAPVEISATPTAGIAIALYQLGDQSYAVVDDRRWVEVADGALVLDHLDPGAALPSLVLEPLAGSSLVVGTCARDIVEVPSGVPTGRIHVVDPDARDEPPVAPEKPSPVVATSSVRCSVRGPAGKHLVRVLYVSSTLSYRAQHDITMTAADHVTLATRFAITAPAWGGTADVTLFDGMPGREQAPIEVARGQIFLDGSTAIVTPPSRSIDAHLRRVYTGEMSNGSDEDDAVSDSVGAVWVWLELEVPRLATGAVHAKVALIDEIDHDVDVPLASREQGTTSLRMPLWIDPALHGARTRRRVGRDNSDMAEWFSLAITNTGIETREVWIEQRLDDSAQRRSVVEAKPTSPTLGRKRARLKVTVAPQKTARATYTILYSY